MGGLFELNLTDTDRKRDRYQLNINIALKRSS